MKRLAFAGLMMVLGLSGRSLAGGLFAADEGVMPYMDLPTVTYPRDHGFNHTGWWPGDDKRTPPSGAPGEGGRRAPRRERGARWNFRSVSYNDAYNDAYNAAAYEDANDGESSPACDACGNECCVPTCCKVKVKCCKERCCHRRCCKEKCCKVKCCKVKCCREKCCKPRCCKPKCCKVKRCCPAPCSLDCGCKGSDQTAGTMLPRFQISDNPGVEAIDAPANLQPAAGLFPAG